MNKTLREILLERHRAAEGLLNAIRDKVLAQELRSTSARNRSANFDFGQVLIRLPVRVWQELFWPCRRIWTALAAAWLVIILVNLLSLEPSAATQNRNRVASPLIWTFHLDQKRLLTELGELAPESPPPTPAVVPRPRSQRPTINVRVC